MSLIKWYFLIGFIVYIPIMLQIIKNQWKSLSLFTLLAILIWSLLILVWPIAIVISFYALVDVLTFWKKR